MSVIILQDEIVHYEVLGRGKPLFFLHGWVGSWRYWIPSMQAASISYRTYALDLWGFGDTAKNSDLYTIDQQARLLDSFLHEMGIQKISLIGHGLGALISIYFASKYQGSVDRIMAISLPTNHYPLSPRFHSSSSQQLADWLITPSSDSANMYFESQKADHLAIQNSLAEIKEKDYSGLMQELITPCLYIYGRKDPAIENTSADDINPNPSETYHQIFFEQSGHFPMMDESSKFNRLVADFLSLDSGVSPRQLKLKEAWKRKIR